MDGGRYQVTFETGRRYQVHKSYVWLGPLVATAFLVVVVGLNSIQGIMALLAFAQEHGFLGNALLVFGAVVLVVLIVYGLLFALYLLAYKNMSYVFDEREFSFYSGIITKRRVHLPYARVQSVNHRASVIQRLAGVCTVSIDSAGGAANKALRVPYLRLETAERMRIDLFVRKAAVEAGLEAAVVYDPYADTASEQGAQAEADRQKQERSAAPTAPVGYAQAGFAQGDGLPMAPVSGQSAQPTGPTGAPNLLDAAGGVVGDWRGAYGGAVAGLEPASYELGLSNNELLLTSSSHAAPLAIGVSVGLSVLFVMAGIALAGDDVTRMVLTLAIPVTVGSAIVSWLLGVLGVAISYGNFRLRRRGSRIEVERGLLQREFSGIDVARIQSVEVRQSFIRRMIGYCEISLGRVSAGGDDSQKNNSPETRGLVVHPFVKIDRVDEILDALLPEFSDRPRGSDVSSLPAPALRRSILRRCVWYNASLLLMALGIVFWLMVGMTPGGTVPALKTLANAVLASSIAIAVLYTVARAVGAVLWARRSGYAWNRNYLVLYNDGLSTARSTIFRPKIQSGATRDNPFQRRLHLTSLLATTAAGTSSTSTRLLDVPEEVGWAYLDWVKPRRSCADERTDPACDAR